MSTEPLAEASSDGTLPDTQQQNPSASATQPDTTTADSTQQQLSSSTAAAASTTAEDSAPLEMKHEEELDREINLPQSSADPMNTDSSIDMPQTQTQTQTQSQIPSQDQQQDSAIPNTHHPTVLEPRIPQKKDASLREFLGKMDDYAPLIPDAVTDYYLTVAGLPPPPETDRRLARLLALATQKFIADVAADAYQYSRIRSTNTTSNNPLTGLGGAAGFGMMNVPQASNAAAGEGGEGGGAGGKGGKKDTAKAAPLGGPRAGYGGGGAGGGQGRTVLTMEDLGMAVGEYGVNVKRGEFYR